MRCSSSGAPTRNYSLDIDYEYRQDSNLYYLTGLMQGRHTILVLMPGNAGQAGSPVREGGGPRSGTLARACAAPGRSCRSDWHSHSSRHAAVRRVCGPMLTRHGFDAISEDEAAAFFGALAAGHGKLAAGESGSVNDPLTRPMEFARGARDRFGGFQTIDATPILTEFRAVKTPYEQKGAQSRASDLERFRQMARMRAGVGASRIRGAVDSV